MKKAERYPWVIGWLDDISEGGAPACSELQFHPTRKWRFDFAIPAFHIAVEVDGGVWSGGRHSGGAGQIKDMEKGNAAVMLGWRVLHYTPQQIKSKKWLEDVKALIEAS